MWFQVVGTNGIQGVKCVWEGVRRLRLNLQCQKEVLEGAAAVVALIHKLLSLRDIVSYAVICRVCPRHGMQIHIQTCTCADQYTYSYLDMSMSSAVCSWG